MKLEVNRNELVGALIALGKLVCRTAAEAEFKALRIEAEENRVRFSTCSQSEQITFKTECRSEGAFHCIVGFDEFRDAVRGCRNKVLEIEDNEGTLRIGDRTLFPMFGVEWRVPGEGEHCSVSELPEGFVSLLAEAAQLVNRNEPRMIMRGINLSREGITATNGRELLNICVPLNVDDFTIPLPLALMQTRTAESGRLYTWSDNLNRGCRIETEHWTWYAKGLPGNYPNWRQIIPAQNTLVRSVSFLPERGQQLETFLKNIPDQPPHNAVELYQSDPGYLNVLAGEMHTSIAAEFTGDWNDVSLMLNKHVFLRLLSEGHTKIEMVDNRIPILASGGTGRYVTMPLYQPKSKETTQIQTQNQPQTEETKMEHKEMKVVSAPVQTAAPKQEPEANPMEELNSAIESFRLKLRIAWDESSVLARKVKEVQIAQKQKERDFIQAKRAIERIRMVSGF